MRYCCLFFVAFFVFLLPAEAKTESEKPQDDDYRTVTVVPADSIETIDSTNYDLHSPKRAILFSAVCPGLGQAYNHKYWKIPIVYGAFMGLSYGIIWNNQYYKDYKQGYLDFLSQTPNPTWQSLVVTGMENNDSHMSWVRQVLKQKRDRYRRYRDMCIIGIAAIYVVNIVDAFVDAQLMDFDISQDLSMNVSPNVIRNHDNSRAVGVNINLHF